MTANCQSHTGSLIPRDIIDKIVVNQKDLLYTYRAIEEAHWEYLDNYRDLNRRKYPSYNLYQFTKILFDAKDLAVHDIENGIREYNKYKKSLPTAGVIFYHNGINRMFVVVRMKHAKIYSMPKGKKDTIDGHSLLKTASREFKEETGIDLDDLINNDTAHKSINKTLFYLVESDSINRTFTGYNTNEIGSVKWVSTRDVLRTQDRYSKQTVATARYLEDYIK